MSDITFNAMLNEIDSFSYNQCVTLLGKLSDILKEWTPKNDEQKDLFYSNENMKFLERGAIAIRNGQGKEHELIEADS